MSDWITHRQPTKEDKDKDGELWMMHTRGWEPPSTPQPKPEATAPEPIDAEFFPPTKEIPQPILTGACPFYVLVISDDGGGKLHGSPIVWEHEMPEGTTLQGALQHQQRVGSRYGTTYLAECRIIPETARHAS